jgi:O-antigen/teichoic acid export membrane protein
MTIRKRMLHGSAMIAAGQMIGKGLSLVRNVIVARMVMPADFGIAATFGITTSLIEMSTEFGKGYQVVQSEGGNSPEFMAVTHMLSAIRGLINALILFVLAAPLANLFNVPQATWAFRWLALYPLLKNVIHFDTFRIQREVKFAPTVFVEVASQTVATLIAWPLTAWLRNYSALLWLILIQQAAAMVCTFLVAKQPYRWKWDKTYARKIVRFGWPLVLTAVFMFCTYQGDRMMIGSASKFFSAAHYTMSDLGLYSAAFTLSLVVASAVTAAIAAPLLPVMSQAQGDPPRFARRYSLSVQTIAVLSGALAILFILGGKAAIHFLYGQRYVGAGIFIGWLGAAQALRILRGVTAFAAIAKGDTTNSLIANMVRATALIGVVIVAAYGGRLIYMCAVGLGTEVLAVLTSIILLRTKHGIPMRLALVPFAVTCAAMLLAALAANSGLSLAGMPAAIVACVVGTLLLLAGAAFVFPELRRELQYFGWKSVAS